MKGSSYQENNAYMIEIENSFNGAIQMDKETGMPAAAKGIRNGTDMVLQTSAERQRSILEIFLSVREGRFLLCVMLVLK